MPIEVACGCGQRFRADERFLGKQAKCTGCGNVITIQPAPPANLSATAAPTKAQPIVVACQCGAKFSARPELRGKTVPCPQCKEPLSIGATPQRRPPTPAAAAHPDPLANSLWDDLPTTESSLGPATGARSLGPAQPFAGQGGGSRKIGFDLMANRKFSEVIAGIILSLIALMGGIGLFFGLRSAAAEHGDVSKWPTSTGTITSGNLVEDGFRRGRQKYRAQIQFKYQVNGTEFSSDHITVGHSPSGNSFTPQMALDKYPVGSTHTVYYNPNDYTYAILERGGASAIIPYLMVSLLVIGGIGGSVVTCASLAYRLT